MSPLAVAILTQSNLKDFNDEDHILAAALTARGHRPEFIVWDQEGTDWSKFDCALLRTTWDYSVKLEKFCEAILTIDQSSCRLFNPAEVVLWNVNKSYLVELGAKEVPTIPTVWCDAFDPLALENYSEEIGAQDFIIKPAVGACASNLFRIESATDFLKDKTKMTALKAQLRNKEVLIQPFIKSVEREGEYSFHFFGGEFSHAILKKAKSGDFRVQQEFGGSVVPYSPTAIELAQARVPLQHIPGDWLFARVDMIRGDHNNLWLIELEAVEPALYFNFSPNHEAAGKLVAALEKKMK